MNERDFLVLSGACLIIVILACFLHGCVSVIPRRIEKPIVTHWSTYPLKVYSTNDDVETAVKHFNRWVGRELLERVSTSGESDIVVTVFPTSRLASGSGRDVLGQVFFRGSRAEILIAGDLTYTMLIGTMMHEFGHVLGVPHNDYPGTLMYWDLWGDDPLWVEDSNMPRCPDIPRMSDTTRDYLRGL